MIGDIVNQEVETPEPEGSLAERNPEEFKILPEWGDFPVTIDSTMLSDFRSCPLKFFRRHVQGLVASTSSIHLLAGGAYAAGLEAARRAYYIDGQTESRARLEGFKALIRHWGEEDPHLDEAKSLPNMVLALEKALDIWPLGADSIEPFIRPGATGIEHSFAHELPIKHPQSGEPLLFVGRLDMLCRYGEALFGLDDKTSSAIGSTWGSQWNLRGQFLGYAWALRQEDLPAAGILVRGLAIQKTGFKHAETPVYTPDWLVDRWYTQTLHDLNRMITSWQSGFWSMDFGEACTAYGGCPYKSLCTSPKPHLWIPTNFVQKFWNPLD